MDLLQLRYFEMVAHYEHMTRAAEELHIAQPALSKMISKLEKELGVPLFDRRGKYIHLNQFGKIFLKRVEEALMTLENGKNEVNDLAANISGEVRLAVLAASNLLPELLTSFRKEYPNINLSLIQHFSNTIAKPDYDLCISSSSINTEDFHSTALITEEIYLAVPIDHILAKRSSICLTEAADDKFISLRPGKSLRETTDTFCRYAGFTPHIIFESDDPATVRGLIRAGLGVAFIPTVTWGGSAGASMTLLHIEKPKCERTITLSYKADRYLPQAAQLLRDFIIEYFSKLA